MKVLLLYYSYTGNTEKLALGIKERIEKKINVNTIKVEPERDISYLSKCMYSLLGRTLPVRNQFIDESYDCVVMGFPVWAFSPSAYFNSMLNLFTTQGKCILFCSFEDSGAKRTLKIAQKRAEARGLKVVYAEAFKEGEDYEEKLKTLTNVIK